MFRREKAAQNRVLVPEDVGRPLTESGSELGPQPMRTSTHERISSAIAMLQTGLEAVVCAAQQKTGASAAALALMDGETLICRARAGRMAPGLGIALNAKMGITGTCVRTGETLNCSDAEKDALARIIHEKWSDVRFLV
jgi:hypothetical protein